MSGGGWSCPHELNDRCGKVKNLPCDPGMKGCELYGRYVFLDANKNARLVSRKQMTDDRLSSVLRPPSSEYS
jgi:hypothetical protein